MIRVLRAVILTAVAVLATMVVTDGTASAGTVGYSPTQLSHRCAVLKSEDYFGVIRQYVHCADLFAVRTSATTTQIWAQGQDVCQVDDGTAIACGRIDTYIGLYRYDDEAAIQGPVYTWCEFGTARSCPEGRFVHSIPHNNLPSPGACYSVYAGTSDTFKTVLAPGTVSGPISSYAFKVCGNGTYTAL
jgi:hypothetical protein